MCLILSSILINKNKQIHYTFAPLFCMYLFALYYATLELIEGRDWKSDALLSLAGVFMPKRENVVPVALSRFLSDYPEITDLHLHLDNDEVGKGAAAGIIGGLKDKYSVYDEPPSYGKDVNDQLKKRVGLIKERECER